jgi:hypothetical protein
MTKLKNTNSLAFKHAVFAYLLDCVDATGYGVELHSDAEKIAFVFSTFRAEYDNEYNRRAHGNNQQMMFAAWLSGLPSSFNIEFRNHAILDLARQWHGVETLTDQQEDIILAGWFRFIAIKSFQLAAALGVQV